MKRWVDSGKISTEVAPAKSSASFRLSRPIVIVATVLLIALIAVTLLLFDRRTPAVDSIAILPFANDGGSADAEYLSDGITESIINSLSQLAKLRVTARSLVFRYKSRDVDPRKAGEELNVNAVLTGRVVQRGNNLIVQAELVDVSMPCCRF